MRNMKKFVAIILAFVTLGCWGVSLAAADELGLGYFSVGGTSLTGPAYDWWYGCSPTSAGMMMGYYDRKGYGGLNYNNLVPSGVAETTTFPNANNWNYLANNAIASWGYVTDFYRSASGTPDYYTSGNGAYGVSGDDRTPTHTFNCLADFMGTSQWALGNVNGGTTFYYFTNGAKFYARDAVKYGVSNQDGMFGMDEYFRYAGYGTGTLSGDTNFYTQAIKKGKMTQGFTFADYKAEINAGRVVMIQLDGHSVFGYGYDDKKQLVYLNDTWSEGVHSMIWGGSYGGMAEWGVVCFTPTGGSAMLSSSGGSAVPLPSTFLLMVSGLVGLAGLRRRVGKR